MGRAIKTPSVKTPTENDKGDGKKTDKPSRTLVEASDRTSDETNYTKDCDTIEMPLVQALNENGKGDKRKRTEPSKIAAEASGKSPAAKKSKPVASNPGCRIQMLKFVHITKNAGTAIEKWAAKQNLKWGKGMNAAFQEARRDLLPPFQGKLQSEPWHIPPQYFRANPYGGFESFAVVRNPYERMISEFRCKWKGFHAPACSSKTSLAESKAKRAAATDADLNGWIQKKIHNMRRPDSEDTSGQRSGNLCVFTNGHCVPQHLYIILSDGNRCVPLQNTLRFENLETEFPALLQRYGMVDAPSLEKVNESDMRKFYISDLTESSLRLIEDAYATDFEAFGYEKLSPNL